MEMMECMQRAIDFMEDNLCDKLSMEDRKSVV